MNDNIQKAIAILKKEFTCIGSVSLHVDINDNCGGPCLRIHGYKGDMVGAGTLRLERGDMLSKEVEINGCRVIYFGELVPSEPSTANASELPCAREKQFDAEC